MSLCYTCINTIQTLVSIKVVFSICRPDAHDRFGDKNLDLDLFSNQRYIHLTLYGLY